MRKTFMRSVPLSLLLGALAACSAAPSTQPASGTPSKPAASQVASVQPATSQSAVSPKPALGSGAPASAAASGGGSQPGKPLTKVIQALPSHDFGFLPQIVALNRGFFAQEGLDVQLPVMNSNAAIPALTNKEIQFGIAGSGVRAAYQGAPLKAIFYTYNYSTLIAVAAPSVKSYKDLKGKKLAIASPGSSEDFASRQILQHENIPVSEVQIVGVGQGPQRVEAMLAGQVQFTVLNADLAVSMQQKGYNILGDLHELMPIPFSGFAVHDDTLKQQPDLIKAWLRANLRALLFLKSNKQDVAAVAAKEFNIDQTVAQQAIELVLPAIDENDPGGFTQEGLILNTKQDMEALKMSGDPLATGTKVHDVTLLRQVQREMGIRCTKGYQCQ